MGQSVDLATEAAEAAVRLVWEAVFGEVGAGLKEEVAMETVVEARAKAAEATAKGEEGEEEARALAERRREPSWRR